MAARTRRGRPSRKAGDSEDRRLRILSEADTLFCERGYSGVSMRDVAQAAGVNKALIFYYFASKDELFDAVLSRYYAAHAAALERVLGQEGPLRARVHELLDVYMDFIDANHRYPRLIQQEIAREGGHLVLIRKHLATLFRFIESALQAMLPSEGPLAPRQFFLTLSGMTINYYTYAPVLREEWGSDPLGPPGLRERREHVHWVVDTLLDRMEREGALRSSASDSDSDSDSVLRSPSSDSDSVRRSPSSDSDSDSEPAG